VSALFSPIQVGGLTLPNRVVVSPMCQFSSVDGLAMPWHWQHIGGLALSGASAVIMEACGVEPQGRISDADLGLWDDATEASLARLIEGVRSYSSTVIGLQLAHAGRKGSMWAPASGRRGWQAPEDGGWIPDAPSALPFGDLATPNALDDAGMARIRSAFVDAARRADRAGFGLIELHGAHGYLLHEFVSPLSNRRTDAYGGSAENRMRFPLEVARAIRAVWPKDKAFGARITGSDWTEGGIVPDDAAAYAAALEAAGLDYVCVSSGANTPDPPPNPGQPGYQVPFAERVKAEVDIPVMAVGMIVTPGQAEAVIAEGRADMVALARGFLDDPRWAVHAAAALGAPPPIARQYMGAGPAAWPGYRMAHAKG
jgi:2,4-dienoyl-CoA reductase-like NADH-dependent reductase (Old Yellow Enzyme family)